MPHDHAHHHGHDCGGHQHHHAPASFGRAFAVGISLNVIFIVTEIVYGLKANSLSLLADAGHNVSDVLGLFLAWGATILAKRKPSGRFTYGMRSSSIIASLTNAIMLMVVVGGIGWESMLRFQRPEHSGGMVVMVVAAIGVFINGFTALLFMRGSKTDLNIRGAYLHMAGDAAISLGVVVTGFFMMKTGWLWLDPLTSLIIAILIIAGTWELLRESLNLALQGVPRNIESEKVKAYLKSLAGVREVHDLHIWAMSTTEVACSMHLVMTNGHPGDAFIKNIAHELEHDFKITHTTIQIEIGDTGVECALAPDHVV